MRGRAPTSRCRRRPRVGRVLTAAIVVSGSALPAAAVDAPALRAQEVARPTTPEALARSVAAAWASGDGDAVTRHFAGTGVALELPGSSNPAVRPAQARAALQRLFRSQETREVRVVEVKRLGGTPPRGLARLVWRVASGGAARSHPLFLALVDDGAGWSVTEIRLLPGRSPLPTTTRQP